MVLLRYGPNGFDDFVALESAESQHALDVVWDSSALGGEFLFDQLPAADVLDDSVACRCGGDRKPRP